MTFIVTLIALLVERFFDWSHLRSWDWYTYYEETILKRFSFKLTELNLALTVLPILFAVALVKYILDGWLYGFAKLLFDTAILIYCLGPKNLWADVFSSINAFTHAVQQPVASNITDGSTTGDHTQFLENIFINAHSRVFAVTFWYVLLGPVGAVLYRMLSVIQLSTVSQLHQVAQSAFGLLNWLPIRVFTFIFALGGHFATVLNVWRSKLSQPIQFNDAFLAECGAAALREEESSGELSSLERNAMNLLDRVFVIWLAVVAVIVLIL